VQFRTDYAAGYSQATKPNSSDGLFFVNGPVDITSSDKGESLLWNQPRVVLLEAGVQVGDEVGPTDDSWEMVAGGSGFRVIHQPVDGVGSVVQVGGGGGSGGSEWIEFTVVDVFCKGDYDNEEDEFYITATVDWYSNSCTTAPTGYDEYTGTIKIYDKCVLQYYTPDQLMGLNGHTVKSGLASLMRPFRKDTCEPRWLCQSVCGEVLCGDTDWPPEDEEETE
jgi:hypothetical protein